MRKPKNKRDKEFKAEHPARTVSPSPMVFGRKPPEALKREIATLSQKDGFEDIIIYGPDNAFPLRLAQAVDESPAASSCIDTIAKFIQGSGFSDEELMTLPVDASGTTLWDLHCTLSESLAIFWGFAVNFKYTNAGKIDQAFHTAFESCRFAMPPEKDPNITAIRYNPYYGTAEYREEYTTTYGVFNPARIPDEKKQWGTKSKLAEYPGQIYYYGKTSPLSRFYPKPKYWSAKEAIQADHKLQEFHNEELDNGFFQSVLINVIGDPNKMSNNPRTMREELQSDGTTIKLIPTKTVGEEFNDMMSAAFSGTAKAGTAMVLWSLTADTAVKIQIFPNGINGDRIIATQDSITKTITIATQVPSILANISEGVSLGSGGSEIQKAVELMQSRTVGWRQILQNFYNKILFPNMAKGPGKGKKVEIQNYNPVSEPVEVNKEIWAFLNDEEKVAFIKKNMPEIEIIRPEPTALPETTAPQIDQETGEPLPVQPPAPKPNEALKDLNLVQIKRIQKIVRQFNTGEITYDQAKQILMSYGLTEEDLSAWLIKPEEI